MSQLPNSLKRTMSFSEPILPRKSSRMSLRRTESFLSLSDSSDDESGSFLHLSSTSPSISPYPRAIVYSKEHHKLGPRTRPEFTIGSSQSYAAATKLPRKRCAQPVGQRPLSPSPAPTPKNTGLRTSSPLAPSRKLLPPRASFPRSKPEPDLYRFAIKTRMAHSPEGEKILRMGPRLAVTMLTATRELERIVSAAAEDDDSIMEDDSLMMPPASGRHWRVVSYGQEVQCGA
ncbi:hypothetical protein EDD17DRAFT_1466596 [Pisolithus thermaeus]|nr:hypothetical protein EV401DRAFT_1290585 [Pisolithus croceorrhizus]KAI6167963.1 hypothetical protein EDD17DRAFT_1466596 [Pisolithus thermaeus]